MYSDNNQTWNGKRNDSQKNFDKLSLGEQARAVNKLCDLLSEFLTEQGVQQPAPTSTPVESEPAAVIKTPTQRMRKAVQRFDAMTDGQQVDQLKAMWGEG